MVYYVESWSLNILEDVKGSQVETGELVRKLKQKE